MCPRPQRPSFFVLPGAKQKHTHPLLQKGFFRRALRRALSSMPFVNMYPMLAFTLAATRKFTPCMCCVLFADLYREWKRERSCTLVHIRLYGEEMKGQWCKIPCRPWVLSVRMMRTAAAVATLCASSGKVSANMWLEREREMRPPRREFIASDNNLRSIPSVNNLQKDNTPLTFF